MDFNKYTQKAQEAIGLAQEIALRRENPEVGCDQLHLALLTQEAVSYTHLDVYKRQEHNPEYSRRPLRPSRCI